MNGTSELKAENIVATRSAAFLYERRIVKGASLTIRGGERVAAVAPYGAGKTTLLAALAGLLPISSGSLTLDGTPYAAPTGDVALIPSTPSSFPWMNARENVEFALKATGVESEAREAKADEALKIVGLEGYETHTPDNASVGFRFRIALARAVAVDPKFLLLDEPFRDASDRLRAELLDALDAAATTTGAGVLLATSNFSTASAFADRVALLAPTPTRVLAEIDGKREGESDKDALRRVRDEAEVQLLEAVGEEHFHFSL
jgi:NitT/TauT family transport system ATP-binding protein